MTLIVYDLFYAHSPRSPLFPHKPCPPQTSGAPPDT